MPIDPRLNCAAEICCSGPPRSLVAAAAILCDAGCPDDLAPQMAAKLREMGVALTSTELTAAIKHIAFPAGRQDDTAGGESL